MFQKVIYHVIHLHVSDEWVKKKLRAHRNNYTKAIKQPPIGISKRTVCMLDKLDRQHQTRMQTKHFIIKSYNITIITMRRQI